MNMNKQIRKMFLGAAIVLGSSLGLGCGGAAETPEVDTCLPESQIDPSAPITRFGIHFMAGAEPLLMGSELTSANGATFKTTKARMYLSEVALIGESGEQIPADLVDETGERFPFGLTLVDLERPESMGLHIRAPAGSYQGMAISVGVPATCSGSGAELNHTDASAMEPPLDVDSDMYWSWDPGYTFLKFEGQVREGEEWEKFFFHVGEEERFAALTLDLPFEIPADGGSGPELVADFNRLLVSPSGEPKPDITNEDERQVHGGTHADSLAENIRGSGFLRLVPGHH
jgi:hypothetical protein